MAIEKAARIEIFKSFGATDKQAEELFVYSRSCLTEQFTPDLSTDEPFIEVWKVYYEESKENGAFNTLRKYLPRLNFPIAEDISKTEEYKDVTLKGNPCNRNYDLLTYPDDLTLSLYQSKAGYIPILFTEHREDFISLVRALAHKNEPYTISNSIGAGMVKGYNNWDRINRYRAIWETENKEKNWSEYFEEFKNHKELYQDRFIILSNNGYSGLNSDAFSLSEEEWRKISFLIRREHECTHYFTERVFGSARNNMFDELIADYAGIIKALGRYDAKWFLTFAGLENYPKYRQGGRMEHYRGNPPLSDGAFIILQRLVYQCALNLEAANEQTVDAEKLIELYGLSLEELAVSQ